MRMEKRKGGAITLSGRHNDRTQPVPNADPERTHLNRILYGPDRPTRELVTEVIREHGGKPRKDSVEAIEFLCKASPEFFAEKDPQKFQEKVDAFVEQAMKFLEDERSGGKLVKAVLHLDEHTPHIHAYKVPIDPAGKLNNKHYMRDREQMERNQDLYYEYMKPLGLERGERRSRATHERIEDFYKSIEAPVRLDVDHDEIPDPPKVLITEKECKKYKDKVTRAVLKQLEEAHKTMRDQAMLARHERGQREEAERKAEVAERLAAERVAATERAAVDRVKEAERTAVEVLTENEKLRELGRSLLKERNDLRAALKEVGREKDEAQLRAKDYQDRLTDIPLHEVMEKMRYGREQLGEGYVYRDRQGRIALRVEGQQLLDHRNQVVCRNSVDLVIHMRQKREGVEGFTQTQALEFLRDQFGDQRAAGAAVAHREQYALEFFGRLRERREERDRALVPQRGDDPWRGPQGRAEDHDRGSHDRGGGPKRGGGGYDFGR